MNQTKSNRSVLRKLALICAALVAPNSIGIVATMANAHAGPDEDLNGYLSTMGVLDVPYETRLKVETAGRLVCLKLRLGMSPAEVVKNVVNQGISPSIAPGLVTSAAQYLCSEQTLRNGFSAGHSTVDQGA